MTPGRAARGAQSRPGLRRALAPVALFVMLLWGIELIDRAIPLSLQRLGVYPRSVAGLAGILLGPLLHGSWYHLVSNSFALLILGGALRYGYPRAAGRVFVLVYLLSGIGVWCLGRESYHIGASGLTHGLLFFIFASGILRRDRLAIALSLSTFLLYGGMIWSIFPREPAISFESHFFGAASGLLAAFLFRRLDPPSPERRYDWEDTPQEDDPPGPRSPAP